MGFRFRKSFKLAPGVRMNMSGSGFSWTLGLRGVSVGMSKRGTYLNTGIPGTGLYSRQKIGEGNTQSGQNQGGFSEVSVSLSLSEDGTLVARDSGSNLLPDYFLSQAKKQKGDQIKDFIRQKCDEINEEIEAIGRLHLETPPPTIKPTYTPRSFQLPMPSFPLLKTGSFLTRIIPTKRERLELENEALQRNYEQELERWEDQKSSFEGSERRIRKLIESEIYQDTAAMDWFLENVFSELTWPRETIVSAELFRGGQLLFLDVDFPESEDMPNKTASFPTRGYKLSFKRMTVKATQELYMNHVHAIAFRSIGTAFYSLPNLQEIVFSGYSQRANKATGQVSDEYLLSVRVNRYAWQEINFDNLEMLDPVQALGNFELRRLMSASGAFSAVEPFAPDRTD